MAHPQIAVFARLADGYTNPTRRIEGQKTLLARTMHSIAYDAIHDEIVVPVPEAGAILTFRGAATGEEPPIRVIQGLKTLLLKPDRLGVDPVHNEILVPDDDQILVFPREATGNVAPIRVIKGPDTKLGAGAVEVDNVHDLLITVGRAGGGGGRYGSSQILIFDRTASGNAKPKAVISGPNTMLTSTGGPFTIHAPTGRILVPIRGPVPFGQMVALDSFVGVWSITDSGNIPPQWILGGPRAGTFEMIRGIAVNAKHKEVIVTDKRMNAVMTFSMPEIF